MYYSPQGEDMITFSKDKTASSRQIIVVYIFICISLFLVNFFYTWVLLEPSVWEITTFQLAIIMLYFFFLYLPIPLLLKHINSKINPYRKRISVLLKISLIQILLITIPYLLVTEDLFYYRNYFLIFSILPLFILPIALLVNHIFKKP